METIQIGFGVLVTLALAWLSYISSQRDRKDTELRQEVDKKMSAETAAVKFDALSQRVDGLKDELDLHRADDKEHHVRIEAKLDALPEKIVNLMKSLKST